MLLFSFAELEEQLVQEKRVLLSAWSLEFRYVIGVGFVYKHARRGIGKRRVILLPIFSSQLSFVLGNLKYFLTRQRVPKCASFLF